MTLADGFGDAAEDGVCERASADAERVLCQLDGFIDG